MPMNFDEIAAAEDRSFIIRGETFTIVRGSPELVGRVVAAERDHAAKPEKDRSEDANLEFVQDRLFMLIDDSNGAVDRWKALRAKEEIGYGEIIRVSNWALEILMGLPTLPPEPSPTGRGKTAASSKAG